MRKKGKKKEKVIKILKKNKKKIWKKVKKYERKEDEKEEMDREWKKTGYDKTLEKDLTGFLSILLFIVFVFSSFVRGPFLPLGAIRTNNQHGASKTAIAHALKQTNI